MSFDAPATFAATLAHYVQLAQQPGCWAYAGEEVRTREAGASGLYRGLQAAWRAQLAGFQPHPSELGEWWKVQSEAERNPAPARPTQRRRP